MALIRDEAHWDSHGAFVAHVASVTGGLVLAGLLGGGERDAIVAAAVAGACVRPVVRVWVVTGAP
ncbi:hypothetical protein [Micromonospora cremea]|uniref:Uncharacterized protein n=1 Tax=Micromonospora cremea TaxID=709881 RepID=A0A1N6AQL9_9ACTN|nr:hypothetical protein [Micromonospora cremea]SIN36234.1 hypothetical protein SAMN04489832_5940 [Micromonospora cremea]